MFHLQKAAAVLMEALGSQQSRRINDSWASPVRKFLPVRQVNTEDTTVTQVLVMMAGQLRRDITQIMDFQGTTQIRTTI